MAIAKRVSNEDVLRRLGDYLYIEDTMPLQPPRNRSQEGKGRGKGSNRLASSVLQTEGFVYTKLNNIFVDLIRLQQSMAIFYNLSDTSKFCST